MLDPKAIPTVLETDDLPKKKLEKFYKAPTAELIAYVDFSVSTTGVLSGVKVHTRGWGEFGTVQLYGTPSDASLTA